MKTVVLYYGVTTIALMFFWALGALWVRRRDQSTKLRELRRTGELLLRENTSLSPDEAIVAAERLLAGAETVVTEASGGDSLPPMVCEMPVWPRSVFQRYKSISNTDQSIELAWHLFAPAGHRRVCVGKSYEVGSGVVLELDTGTVNVGQDVFPSLAHALVFMMD